VQIPEPTASADTMGALVAVIVMAIRWIGIFFVVMMLGGGPRLAAIATINLSQISEFALVICSLGMSQSPPHIEETTLTIIIWTFAMLAILSSYLIGFNSAIYMCFVRCSNRLRGKANDDEHEGNHDAHHDERDIILLGFHKVAWMLVEEFKQKSPELLHKIVVVDFNQDAKQELEDLGIKYAYGDISSPDVLEHAHHGKARIVLCTIPDSLLRGVTNARLIEVSKNIWPEAHVICTADNPFQANMLYGVGADYVLRMSKLCAERLHNLLSEHSLHANGSGELAHLFKFYKARDGALPSTITSVAKRIDRIIGD
jgi:Trk K+ transport system NAD-binding subunit